MANFTITQTIENKIHLLIDLVTTEGYANSGGDKDEGEPYMIGDIGAGSTIFRAFIEWDISSIPDDATINKVYYIYSGSINNIDCKINDILSVRPDTSSGSAIYSAIGSGDTYATPSGFPNDIIRQSIAVLGSTSSSEACVDMMAHLSVGTDWFAIGILSTNESASEITNIYGNTSTYNDVRPILYIDYSLTTDVTLLQPQNISESGERKICTYLLKNSSYKSLDICEAGIVLTMNGTEDSTYSETSMHNIEDMANRGEPITLSNFDDDAINTNWIIKSFNYIKRIGYLTTRYDWELILIKEST